MIYKADPADSLKMQAYITPKNREGEGNEPPSNKIYIYTMNFTVEYYFLSRPKSWNVTRKKRGRGTQGKA